jgi:hypothetical protein
MQHCQHLHTAPNLSNLTWAGQQSATVYLKKRYENNKCSLSSFGATNRQLTAFCTDDKTFHCEVTLHAYQSLSSSYDRLGY